MASEHDIKTIDKRTVARYITRGTVSEKDYEKLLKGLPDMADKCDTVTTQQPAFDRAPAR
jgi:hypothetical protein